MGGFRVGRLLSALRQGVELGVEFGPHSLEALLWVAETIEQSVYAPGSLARSPRGVTFVLSNPPLRTGAFSAVRIRWDGVPVVADAIRFRSGPGGAERSAATVRRSEPLELLIGVPTTFAVDLPAEAIGPTGSVRLELDCPAIPPTVWVEFRDRVDGR